VLADDRARHRYPLVDFDASKRAMIATILAAWPVLDEAALAAAYEDHLVHHEGGDAPAVSGLDDAIALWRLLGAGSRVSRPACAVANPFFQARHLLPQALRAAGRHADARAAMHDAARVALYPHGPLATLAEWSWLDGDHDAALTEMARAIAAAPLHRRGRLRT